MAESENQLGTKSIGGLMMKFAVPCIISLLVNSLYNIVDQIFIGRYVGYLGNGATNVIFPITVVALAVALLVGDGGAAYLSLKLGLGQKEEAAKGVGNAIVISCVFAAAFCLLSYTMLDPMIRLFGATDAIYPFARDYGRIILAGLPFGIVGVTMNSIIRADSSPKYAMFSMIIGAVINTVLDPIFIHVLDMGVKGAAYATILGQIASFLFSIFYLRKFKTISVGKKEYKLSAKTLRIVLPYGISSFITQISVVFVVAVSNNVLVTYGAQSVYGAEIPLTALGIVMKVNQIMISICVGIAVGIQPIVGFNYGAGNYKRVKKAYGYAVGAAVAVMTAAFLVFQLSPMTLINLFGSENELYNTFAEKCFRIFLMLMICNGFQIVSGNFMQALGKPAKAAALSLSRQIVFLIPFTLILPRFLGVEGALWAGPVSDLLAFLLALGLVIHEMADLGKKDRAAKRSDEVV